MTFNVKDFLYLGLEKPQSFTWRGVRAHH